MEERFKDDTRRITNIKNINIMASEIDKLLNELKNMKEEDKVAHILNNKDTWNKIGQNDLAALGFETEEELKQWILNNPYSNI